MSTEVYCWSLGDGGLEKDQVYDDEFGTRQLHIIEDRTPQRLNLMSSQYNYPPYVRLISAWNSWNLLPTASASATASRAIFRPIAPAFPGLRDFANNGSGAEDSTRGRG